ncbi:hypothetical protein GCM10008107_19800 [Psychrosphaera saromensis]|uniref:Uncharacterized protein n=1 Tax=Psychrosphaera saromensis TaxID=716813 RepID=A0A2S7UTS2_9GAMM|nr:hypothetical protein [Psychrosphaera saromensis]PQJ52681.1 hypothetical protein BTO11_02785 [Psychrosphaera saromensis]GHB70442.1 hypothetical protein GCM10008107_19800 [Psychrosphaera saromensis]GLQ13165.1 hypothetical protein GCM10007917_06200 [Psychrosphaera saromensis]
MEIKKIIIKAFYIFSQNKILFLKNFIPTFIMLGAISIVLYTLNIGIQQPSAKLTFSYVSLIFISIITFFIILGKSIVHTHRTFILNEHATIKELFKLTRRDFRFVKNFIVLNLVMLLIGIAIMLVIGGYLIGITESTENEYILFGIGLITTLIIAFFWSRLAIVLPSAALDHSLSIHGAWQVSDDYSGKLFVGVGLLPVITDTIISFIPSYDSYIYSVGVALIWGAVAIIEIGVLSLIYKDITDKQNAPDNLDDADNLDSHPNSIQ